MIAEIIKQSISSQLTLLSAPNISGNEWKYVKECLDTGWVSSVGAYVSRFEELMAQFTGCKYAIATSSGTTALHISLMIAGVERNDYVIVPNITFVASLNSITYTGASPILIDVDEDSWQMDLSLLQKYLEENTTVENGRCVHLKDRRVIRAIMPVHVLGNMVDMEMLQSIADTFHLTIIEDATEALGSYYNHRHSGSFGMLGCFSFNGNKIITTGGGGMIVTNSEQLAKRAKHLSTQAKSDPFEYYHEETGYNYRLVNVLAAIGVAQMEQLPAFIMRKKKIDSLYRTGLEGIGDIQFQSVSNKVDCNSWLFTFKTSSQKKLLQVLNDGNYQSRPFWVPMDQLPMFRNDIYVNEQNISNDVYRKCLSIPCSTNISDREIKEVINIIQSSY